MIGDKFLEELISNIRRYSNERKLVVWGKTELSNMIIERLKENNIEVEFVVDSNPDKIDGIKVNNPIKLENQKSEYYVIVLVRVHEEIKNTLKEFGYEKKDDYYYFTDCVIVETENYYEDAHGNKIVGNHRNCDVFFLGYDSSINIEDGVETEGKIQIQVSDNAKLRINKGTRFVGNVYINCDRDSLIEIGKEVVFRGSSIINLAKRTKVYIGDGNSFASGFHIKSGAYAKLEIGKNGTFEDNFVINLAQESNMAIGDDCMVSLDVSFRSYDGHALFDVKSRKKINAKDNLLKKWSVTIGNHVWIGERVIVLNPTEIKDGCVVGAYSLVKGNFLNNCCIVGNPARIVRKDITWCRDGLTEDINECGLYINLTED